VDVRLGAEARAKGFEDRVDVYQLANLALDLMGAETVDGAEWSRERVEGAAREAEAIGLSDLVRTRWSWSLGGGRAPRRPPGG